MSPISTAASHAIATKFAAQSRIVLTLTPTDSCGSRYFDCELFSIYPDEKEKLFMVAFGSAIVISPSIAYEAVTPPVVGLVRTTT